jgi:hypothetical protein
MSTSQSSEPSGSKSIGRSVLAGLVLLVAAWLLLHLLFHIVIFIATIAAVVFAVVAVVWALRILL